MPAYHYRCELGHRTVKFMHYQNVTQSVICRCGLTADRVYGFNCAPPSLYPRLSNAVGVHPDQVQEAVADAANMGVPTAFTPEGEAVFESADHEKRYLETYGFFDRDAAYSQATPQGENSRAYARAAKKAAESADEWGY